MIVPTTNNQIGPNYNWQGNHILLIDTDWLNYKLHRLHFIHANPLLHFAENTEEAKKLFYTFPINLILTEIYGLDKGGLSFLKEISAHHSTPIIIQTTQNESNDSEFNVGFEYDSIFYKPISWPAYMQSIDDKLQLNRNTRSTDRNRNNRAMTASKVEK